MFFFDFEKEHLCLNSHKTTQLLKLEGKSAVKLMSCHFSWRFYSKLEAVPDLGTSQ